MGPCISAFQLHGYSENNISSIPATAGGTGIQWIIISFSWFSIPGGIIELPQPGLRKVLSHRRHLEHPMQKGSAFLFFLFLFLALKIAPFIINAHKSISQLLCHLTWGFQSIPWRIWFEKRNPQSYWCEIDPQSHALLTQTAKLTTILLSGANYVWETTMWPWC